MNNLTLFLLGLVLVNIPACLSQNNDKQCFSLALTPSYPCCTGDKIVLSDESGDWGVENNKWCGIGDGFTKDSCFSIALKYPCCKSCTVRYIDESGDWGVENGSWCGIKDSCTSNDTDVQGNSDFDFSFLKLENEKRNIVYSPLSIAYALKMLQEGAVGKTYDEITEVVGNKELPKYTSFEKYLSLANGLFIRESYYEHVKINYINTLKERYNAEIIKDSFSSASNANKWIEEKTLGIIKNTLSDDSVRNPDNVMLVINALALDMEWELQFTKDDTSGYTFYKENGENINATTMRQTETHSQYIAYYLNSEITVLTMDLKVYNGTQLEFMAIMPKNNNLSGYIENLTKKQIEEIDSNLKLGSYAQDGVNIRIPKFKFDYELKLIKDLKNMGIVTAFEKWGADFSKMSDAKENGQNLYVSGGIHKAEIEFTEKGARAAAVTVFTMGVAKGLPVKKYPVDVIINKPFLFIIRDKNTKDIWFTGSVYEPNLWENEKDEYLKPVSSPSSGTSSSPSPGLSGTKTTKTIPYY